MGCVAGCVVNLPFTVMWCSWQQDLRLAALLPPLDASHHLRATEWKPYREGVVLKTQPGVGSYVDIGLDRTAFVAQQITPNTRVTLFVGDKPEVEFKADFGENMIVGKVT